MGSGMYYPIIIFLWLSAMVCFCVSTYNGYIRYFETCYSKDSQNGWMMWSFINLLYIVVLIISTSWIYEVGKGSIWSKLSGILALLGGVFLLQLNGSRTFDFYALVYIGIWLILLSYSLVGW